MLRQRLLFPMRFAVRPRIHSEDSHTPSLLSLPRRERSLGTKPVFTQGVENLLIAIIGFPELFNTLLREVKRGNDEVDRLDADKWDEHTAEAINEQVAGEYRGGADWPVLHAAQRQRNQRDDDQGVEDDG